MKLIKNMFVLNTFFSKVLPVSSLNVYPKKLCKDCIHYNGNNIECKKFGDIDIVTGKVTYQNARNVRED